MPRLKTSSPQSPDDALSPTVVWNDKHERLRREYLALRKWGTADAETLIEAEKADRKASPNGLHRLIDLVPTIADDQHSLARLLAETAVLWHAIQFTDRHVFIKACALHELVKDKPAHGALQDALHDYVAMAALLGKGKKETMRDDRIRFAVHMTLEADVKATRQKHITEPCACSLVADVLKETGLSNIGESDVARIWQRRCKA